MSAFRVSLWSADGAGRGPGTFLGHIDDADDIGGSEQANGSGEFFMTLPQNHPLISALSPLQTHYKVARLGASGTYDTIFSGLVDDYEADPNEVVFYGRDYLSLLDTTITSANSSYPSQPVGQIIGSVITGAIAETNSRLGFITTGTINNSPESYVALSSYQSRLAFCKELVDLSAADTTRRPIIQISPRSSLTPSISYLAQSGSDREDVRLEYGGLVNDYFYAPGYSTLRTHAAAIGQKREGATVLYSTQTSAAAPAATYGRIVEPLLFTDVVDQTTLDDMTKRAARRMSRIGKTVGLGIRVNQLGPWEGFDLTDSVRVIINDGIVNVNGLYTVWGVEWTGRKNGSEELVLSLLPKDV